MKRRPDGRNRKSANSPASRARCLKPALHDPRWPDLSGPRRGLSTAAGASLRAGDGQVARQRSHPNPQWRTAGAPGPCSFGCREGVSVFAPSFPGHRPLSQPRDARDFPWMGQVADYIAEYRVIVNKMESVLFMAKCPARRLSSRATPAKRSASRGRPGTHDTLISRRRSVHDCAPRATWVPDRLITFAVRDDNGANCNRRSEHARSLCARGRRP